MTGTLVSNRKLGGDEKDHSMKNALRGRLDVPSVNTAKLRYKKETAQDVKNALPVAQETKTTENREKQLKTVDVEESLCRNHKRQKD